MNELERMQSAMRIWEAKKKGEFKVHQVAVSPLWTVTGWVVEKDDPDQDRLKRVLKVRAISKEMADLKFRDQCKENDEKVVLVLYVEPA